MGSMSCENKNDLKINYYLVGFIDILGQQERLKELGEIRDPRNREGIGEFIEKIKRSFGVVFGFQDIFKDFLSKTSKAKIIPLTSEFEKQKFLELTRADVKFQRFSDGIVLFFSLDEEDSKTPTLGVLNIFSACATMMLHGLLAEQPLRGGLDVGLGMEMHDSEIYGPTVAESYHLESKVAQYPRCVIGEELLNYLYSTRESEENNIYSAYCKKLAGVCIELLTIDFDGHHIVDYLGKGFKKYIARTMDKNDPLRAYDFVLNQQKKWQKEKNTKLSFRYSMLRRYFETRLHFWKETDQ